MSERIPRRMSGTRDTVTLHGMQFHVRVGVLPHESEVAQPVEVDLSVEVDDTTALPNVVDFAVLYDTVAAVMSYPHTGYLEDIAQRIADGVLGVRGVCLAHIAVRKPHVTLPGPLAYAGVSITRSIGRSE